MACRKIARWLLLTSVLVMTRACSPCLAQGIPGKTQKSVTLWVREVHGRALYWVDEKAVKRGPLTGLETALGSDLNVNLKVVLDSRVPTGEIFEIDGMLDKIPIKDVRYYVFTADQPTEMWQLVWNSRPVPLPGKPPASRTR
ncbi:MAG: hypothetical protein ACRD4X_09650 [Candidatus Acidiferrales bacterium]